MNTCKCETCSCGNNFDGKTFINIVLDESYSMDATKRATISGFNEYVGSFRNRDNVFVTLTKFNTSSHVVYSDVPAKNVPDLNGDSYRPYGGTALFDAVADSCAAMERFVTHRDRVLVVIITDGEENSSKEVRTKDAIKNVIRNKENLGNWTFTYLAANQDAWSTGMNLGMNKGNTFTWVSTPQGTSYAYNIMTRSTANYLDSNVQSVNDFYENEGTINNTPDTDTENTAKVL